MLTLFQTQPSFGLPNASPFCMKLEAFLRWQGIPFQNQDAIPNKGPFGKVPFIEKDGLRMGDSTAIIESLMKEHQIQYDETLNQHLGHVFQRMVEEHLYWAMVYFRWTDETIWPKLRDAFFGSIPFFIRPVIVSVSLKQAKQALHGQGMGRLTDQMVLERAKKDLYALDQQLSTTAFICGAEMTHYDLSIWAVLSQLMQCELELPITSFALTQSNLVAYLERVNAVLIPKWEGRFRFANSDATSVPLVTI
jgi:glutathione S-transferase